MLRLRLGQETRRPTSRAGQRKARVLQPDSTGPSLVPWVPVAPAQGVSARHYAASCWWRPKNEREAPSRLNERFTWAVKTTQSLRTCSSDKCRTTSIAELRTLQEQDSVAAILVGYGRLSWYRALEWGWHRLGGERHGGCRRGAHPGP
jgi:hypothetical protein